jgi:D-alanyl-lipoteichoic acid acyltransferase DltB (MBOAT superfamily)
LIPQFDPPPDPRYVDTTRAFALIAGGLFKKVVIATALARFVDPVFGAPEQYSSLVVLVAIYAYAIQIYADFSGYTDMAIGIALLLGFRLPQNFNRPYSASSLREFWRRWHMTLSRWLRDYLYIPLGGNRKGKMRTYVNIMLTMLLGGLWHGASWTFVVWGALNGLGLVVDHWWVSRREAKGGPEPAASGPRRWAMVFLTFNFVCLAWVFFREQTIGGAFQLLGHLFTAWDKPSPQITVGVLLAIAALLVTQFTPPRIGEQLQGIFSRISPIAQGACLGVAMMFINLLGPYGVAPFIYFQF